jgi:hypothetical protein
MPSDWLRVSEQVDQRVKEIRQDFEATMEKFQKGVDETIEAAKRDEVLIAIRQLTTRIEALENKLSEEN